MRILCTFLILGATLSMPHATAHEDNAPAKRLIEFGWDTPTPDFVHAYIDQMTGRPFDGIVFRMRGAPRPLPPGSDMPFLASDDGPVDLQGASRVLHPEPLREGDLARECELLADIEWGRFTDNFLLLYAASDQDWFDDEHWAAIENNARLLARAARIGRCAGVLFDAEPYGPSPWDYGKQPRRGEKTFAEYESQVRARGARFMHALRAEFPGIQVLTLFMYSIFADHAGPMPPDARGARLQEDRYGLLGAFCEGMLGACTAAERLHDGNEGAYYYTDRAEYLESYHYMRDRARVFLPPALRDRYAGVVRAAQSVYLDEYLDTRPGDTRPSDFMTLEERRQWTVHNVFWALYTADRYAWCYSERVVWWDFPGLTEQRLRDMGMAWPTRGPLPDGCEQALREARQCIQEGRIPAIDLRPVMDRVDRDRRLF